MVVAARTNVVDVAADKFAWGREFAHLAGQEDERANYLGPKRAKSLWTNT